MITIDRNAHQLLAIARRGAGRLPYRLQIGAEREQAASVFGAEGARSFAFTPGELGLGVLELAQALFPLAFETTGDEPVLGIDSAVAALGPLCLVPGTLGGAPPLGQRASRSASNRSAAARAASRPAGASAARTARATAASICTAPTLRQNMPRPSTMLLPAQW
jgi:hypothetical protein